MVTPSARNEVGGWKAYSRAAFADYSDSDEDGDEGHMALGARARVRYTGANGKKVYCTVVAGTEVSSRVRLAAGGKIVKVPNGELEVFNDTANLAELEYSMRAVMDTGATGVFLPHPHFCVEGSVREIEGPWPVSGMAKKGQTLQVTHTATLRLYSNVQGVDLYVELPDSLIVPGISRALIGVPVLDDLGYFVIVGGGQCVVRHEEAGPNIVVLPRLPEQKGKLVDEEDAFDCAPTIGLAKGPGGRRHKLYPIPDLCFLPPGTRRQ